MTDIADLLFRPRSIVVYGASSDPEKLSGRPLDYLKRLGYQGDFFAVNPRRDSVQEVPSYADVAEVPGPVDLAIVVLPAKEAVEALRSCAEANVGAAIVFASGFDESVNGDRQLQAELRELVATSTMRVVGPNCLGAFCAHEGTFATFSTAFDASHDLPDSPIALVSQSGAVGTFTFSAMSALGVGVRYFANPGNQADVTAVELLRSLVEYPDVEILLGHLEDGRDLEGVEALARRARELGKPLVILKAGRTPAGARAIAAHTASHAGDDVALTHLLNQHGCIRVESMEEMADTALGLVSRRRVEGPRVTIVTLSGGAGALAADAATDLGLRVEPWDGKEQEAFARLPYFASTLNPIDVTGAMINDIGILEEVLTIVNGHDATDAVLVVLGNADKGSAEIVATLKAAHSNSEKPMVVAWTGGDGAARAALLELGIPTYEEPLRAVRTLSHLAGAR